MKHELLILSLLLACSSAGAQEVPEAEVEAPQVVEVGGVKNPELKSYKVMLKGVDAFDEHRKYAPAAPMKFKLVSATPGAQVDGVTLRIAGDNTSENVPIAADGTFVLPRIQAAIDDKADLVTNKRKSLVRWRGDIHTPGVPANARRLGDLRMECEIGWAVNREDIPFLIRSGLSLAGGACHIKSVQLRYQAPLNAAGVTLVSGDRRLPLPFIPKYKNVFSPPLADTSWDDETLIEYDIPAAPM
ncbi:hypothetical protein [Duganella violaceipulchra]|uniref:DUF4424 domain-containing protein n=1 Tax=Duganella violaceipulchra TaxID=2849652 RepID=A0AA41HHI0_9BURK|nr:hypothetical protein [Duganella violaceicalia]MBV6323873.1 hypothetical protein [Duganella violaceicalia]MCP2007565.1 hypothetical protein [Duganella violaceicalia]